MNNPGIQSLFQSQQQNPYARRSSGIPGMQMPQFPNPRPTGQVMFPPPPQPGPVPGSGAPPIGTPTDPQPIIPDNPVGAP
jgi:hypothetical protein